MTKDEITGTIPGWKTAIFRDAHGRAYWRNDGLPLEAPQIETEEGKKYLVEHGLRQEESGTIVRLEPVLIGRFPTSRFARGLARFFDWILGS